MSGHYQGANITAMAIPSFSDLIKHTREENDKYVLTVTEKSTAVFNRQPSNEVALLTVP